MLKVKNLSVCYDGKSAVNDVSFEVLHGETVCIVGESGSGKTTIIKTIMELLPSSANITNGQIFHKNEISKRVCPTEMSIVFQDTKSALNPVRKIGSQFVEYIRKHKTISKNDGYDLAVKMLAKLNLDESVMKAYPCQLSGGMMQRVGLAFSLSLTPKLLLLDEPTSALDVTTQAKVIDEILKLRREFGVSILMITHNIPLAIYVADRVIVMKNGEIVEMNTSKEILQNPKHDYTKTLIENIAKLEVL